MSNVTILSDLVKLQSFNQTNFEIIDYISSFLNKNDIEFKLIKNSIDAKLNLVAGLNCKLSNLNNAILLCGHIDTVNASKNVWKTNPFRLTISNGKAYGLGTADMKSFTANILSNVNTLKTFKGFPLVLCLTSDEETVMNGVKQVCSTLQKFNINPSYAIIGEPTQSLPYNCNKGFYETEITVKGKACHSSMPQNGVNSIVVASKIINKLNSISKTLDKNSTLNVGIVNGGTLCNVVPELTKIRFEIRTFNKDLLTKIYNTLNLTFEKLKQEFLGVKIESNLVFEIPPFKKVANKTLTSVYNFLGAKPQTYAASTEAGFYQTIGATPLIFGVGNIENCHKENEFVCLEEFNSYFTKLETILNLLQNK